MDTLDLAATAATARTQLMAILALRNEAREGQDMAALLAAAATGLKAALPETAGQRLDVSA